MSGFGEWTACDLSNVAPLFSGELPLFSSGARNFSRETARLSLELSALAYSFEVEPWENAGWTDVSFQVDNRLMSGERLNAGGNLWKGAVREVMQHIARARVQRRNPVSQFFGFRRQQTGEADTCKAVIMLHKDGENRYVVAVGFMGTGKRLYDWVSNLRVKIQDGFHEGFLQLTREFAENMSEIEFPSAAKELGLERLTLSDIVEEMKGENSRFRLWASGHSQGGAVLQIFFDFLLRAGAKRENLTGIGFASPSVDSGTVQRPALLYPLTHVLNAEDMVPRVGALSHLGQCLVYVPQRSEYSFLYRTAEDEPCFLPLHQAMFSLRDTAQCLLFGVALMRALACMPTEEIAAAMHKAMTRLMPDKAFTMLDEKLDTGLRFAARHLAARYKDCTGEKTLPVKTLKRYESLQIALLKTYGAAAFLRAFALNATLPHKLAIADDGKNSVAPYLFIVRRGLEGLKQVPLISTAMPVYMTPHAKGQPIRAKRFDRYHPLSSLRCLQKHRRNVKQNRL